MDFITDLPSSGPSSHNAVYTIVDRLTKLTRLIPVRMGESGLSGGECARYFFDHIIRHFGVPSSIVSDRDPRFTSSFWGALHAILGTKLLFSSAFHP